jgi:hypothetical protein
MKKLLTVIIVFFSLSVLAQTGFPVSGTVVSTQGYADLHSMFVAEGKRDGWSTIVTSTTASATVVAGTSAQNGIPGYVKYTVNVNMSFTTTPKGRAVEIQGGTISCSKAASGTYFLNNNPSASYPDFKFEGGAWQCSAGGIDNIVGGGVVRFGAQLLNANIKTITEPWSSTAAPGIGTVTVVEFGYKANLSYLTLTDDLNYPAEMVVDAVGTSILEGTGPTGMNTMFLFLFRNYLSSLGYNVRLRNNSVFGTTSAQQEFRMNSGGLTYPVKSVLGIVEVTANDILTSVNADSTAKRAVRIAKFLQAQNPNSTWLIFAPAPFNNTTNETAAGVTHAAISAAVIALNNPRIKYVPVPRIAFVATTAANYIDTVHWSDLGNALQWGAFRTWFDSNITTLPKPTPR